MDTMNRVDAIYQRHVAVLAQFGLDQEAVRCSLRLALEELKEGARGEAGGLITRIERVLQMHDSALHKDLIAGDIELPTAIDALVHSLTVALATTNQQVATLDKQLASVREEAHELRQENGSMRELQERRNLQAAAYDNTVQLVARMNTDTNGSHANPPYVPDNIDDIRFSKWLRDDDRDWLEGLERGAHSFRMIPKETRRRLVQAHVDAVRMDSETPRQFDFDQARPTWMPTAGGAAATFGVSWGDLCAAKDLPY